jgi:hypothetical protein
MKVWTCRTAAQRGNLEAYFAHLCKNWASKLGVNHWDIDVSLEFGTHVSQEHRELLGGMNGGITICNPTYERATTYLCALDEDTHWSQREIEEIAVHEMVHILLCPVTNTFSGDGSNFLETRTIESVVTRTARALMGWFG